MAAIIQRFFWKACLLIVVLVAKILTTEIQLTSNYSIEWYQVSNDSITFRISVDLNSVGYVGFGISENGGMRGADIVAIIISSLNGSTAQIKDMHGIGNGRPVLDTIQNYKLEEMKRNGTRYTFKISRLINTCDEHDLKITHGTQYLIWSQGAINETTAEIQYHRGYRGAKPVNLLDKNIKTSNLSSYRIWSLRQNINLTGADTLYWCKFHRAPELDKKHHIVGFAVNLTEPLAIKHAHHASILSCTPPEGETAERIFSKYLDDKGYDCYYSDPAVPVKYCKTFDFQWAYGGTPTIFPEDVGISLGESSQPTFYMTMLHINNPSKDAGITFNAGFDMYYTENLRPKEAGFLQLGINSSKAFALTIPPNTTNYVLSSHCPSECTQGLPSEGLNVFLYLLHFHLTGRKMRIRHFRNGTELPWLANDENYDTNYQNNRLMMNEVKILPSDHLTVECIYDSTDRNGAVVIGGRGIMQEMCQAFLMYYPKIRGVNRCGSSVPEKELLGFLGIEEILLPQADNDPFIIAPAKWNNQRYTQVLEKEIHWSVQKRWAYQQMTRYNYHNAECTALSKGVTVSTKYPTLRTSAYTPADECKRTGSGSGSGPCKTTPSSSTPALMESNKLFAYLVILQFFFVAKIF